MLSYRNAPVVKKLKRASIHTAYRLPLDPFTATSGMKSPLRIGQRPVLSGFGQGNGSVSIVLSARNRLIGSWSSMLLGLLQVAPRSVETMNDSSTGPIPPRLRER